MVFFVGGGGGGVSLYSICEVFVTIGRKVF